MIHGRSFSFTAQLDYGSGDGGIVLAHGDQGGGYALYIEDGELRFVENCYGEMVELSAGRVPVGAQSVSVSVANPGRSKWVVEVAIDGEPRARGDDFVGLLGMAPFEGIDVGIDRRSPVSWRLYDRYGAFAYKGALRCVEFVPGELAPDAGERWIDTIREMALRFE
jgi:hypothetical protein